jgi:hypothetical protein
MSVEACIAIDVTKSRKPIHASAGTEPYGAKHKKNGPKPTQPSADYLIDAIISANNTTLWSGARWPLACDRGS